MALLKDVIPNLDMDKKPPKLKSSMKNKKAIGKKRRTWLTDNGGDNGLDNKVSMSENLQKGNSTSLSNPGKERGLSTPLAKGVYEPYLSTPFINPIDRPLNRKGVDRPLISNLSDLRGNPLKLIRYFHVLIQDEEDEYRTRRVKLKEIMQQLEISKDSARTALRFLLKTSVINRVEFKAGKLGWSRYDINSSLYNQINEAISKGSIDPFDIGIYCENEKGSITSSSYITTTKNTGMVDFSPLSAIGFTETQVDQLITIQNINFETVQESIYHFAFALENNPRVMNHSNPLNMLMGVLRKGQVWFELNYRPPQELALQKLLETKQAEKARVDKLIDELLHLEFSDWTKSLSDTEIETIVPPAERRGGAKEAALRRHYKNEILLPRLKSEGLL